MNPQEIIARALELSGLDKDDVEALSRFIPRRFNGFADVWEVGQPSPAPGYVVFAIFTGPNFDPIDSHVAGDVRVYCLPQPPNTQPCVFTLNRVSPTGFQSPFALLDEDGFAETIGQEWSGLAEAVALFDDEEDEDESVECPNCSHSTAVSSSNEDAEDPIATWCGHCGGKLPEVAVEATQ